MRKWLDDSGIQEDGAGLKKPATIFFYNIIFISTGYIKGTPSIGRCSKYRKMGYN
jgi:hypothetical protein